MLRQDRIPSTPALPPRITTERAAGGLGDWAAPGFCFTLQMAGTTREGQSPLQTAGSRLGYQFQVLFLSAKAELAGAGRKPQKETHGTSGAAAWGSAGSSPLSEAVTHQRLTLPSTAAREVLWVTIPESGLKSKALTGHWNLDPGRSH